MQIDHLLKPFLGYLSQINHQVQFQKNNVMSLITLGKIFTIFFNTYDYKLHK